MNFNRFLIIVIAGNFAEFKYFAKEKLGNSYEKLEGNHFDLLSGKFYYRYLYPGRSPKIVQELKAHKIDSWEIFGTGIHRGDCEKIVKYCKINWTMNNPCDGMANNKNVFVHLPTARGRKDYDNQSKNSYQFAL